MKLLVYQLDLTQRAHYISLGDNVSFSAFETFYSFKSYHLLSLQTVKDKSSFGGLFFYLASGRFEQGKSGVSLSSL